MTNIDLRRILESCAWADAVALVDIERAMILHCEGRIPDEPIRGMLGGAIGDMMAGSNVQAIVEEFARARGPVSGQRLGHGVDEIIFRVGRRWHFAVRIDSASGQYALVLSGPKPTIGLALAQSEAAAARLAGVSFV